MDDWWCNAAEPYLGRRALRPQPEGHQLRAGAAEGVTRDLRARSGPVFYAAPREYFLHGCATVDYFLSPKSSFPIGFSRSRGGPRGPRACSRRARGRPSSSVTAAVGLTVEPKILALVHEHFLWRFPYLERIQEGSPQGAKGSCRTPGPPRARGAAAFRAEMFRP